MTSITQYVRLLFIMVIVAALLTPRTPFFAPEDVNRDARVDLRDAVELVRGFARMADGSGDFRGEVGRVISVLRVVSKSDSSLEENHVPEISNRLDMFSCNNFSLSISLLFFRSPKDELEKYNTMALKPATPPPKPLSA